MEEIDKKNFKKIRDELRSIKDEIDKLSAKKPNDSINEFKLEIINKILAEFNEIFSEEYKPIGTFDQFNKESLTTNSDVVFILSQYLSCAELISSEKLIY